MAPPAATINSSVMYFGALCDQVTSDSSLSVKQEIIAGFVSRYSGDLGLLFKLLLPKFNGRLYHLQDKQLIKLFAIALKVSEKTIKDDVNSTGCIAQTVQKLFKPRATATIDAATGWCNLTLEDLDSHLEALSKVTQEDAQLAAIQAFLNVACKKAVFIYLRQVKQDLRLGAGIRVVLAGLHPSANNIFKQCANIQQVVKRVQSGDVNVTVDEEDDDAASGARSPSPPGGRLKKGDIVASITIGMPMSPMLAAPSKGVDQVLSKCPNGAFSETKYDGERIQIHKNGSAFSFFARSLKPMKADKYEGLEKFLAKAVKADTCILDGEILLVDIATSQPLPFGTLGKNKKAQFTTACTCIVLFDMMLLNGVSLLMTPLEERRKQMSVAVEFIPNRVMISEMRKVLGTLEQRTHILQKHLAHAIAEGLEGLVIKDVKSVYEPGSRHWIKLKKDYLDGMADSADLVVLGGYFGSGNKGGLLSTFLMGVCDKNVPVGGCGRWKTVCKVGNGHDDATIAALNTKYKTSMQAPTNGLPPPWIDIHNSHMPDMFVKDPESSDVWEIIGAEFSTTKTHTASSISFRFPRVLKRRDDKDASTATSLQELVKIVEASKEKSAKVGLAADLPNDDDDELVEAAEQKRAAAHHSTQAAEGRFNRGHAEDEDYMARFSVPTLPESAPLASVEIPLTTPSPTVVTVDASVGTVEYVVSEIAQPLSNPSNPHQNILIVHSTALKGKWSNRGTMGSITKYLGEEPQEAYAELSPKISLGEIIFCEVSNRLSSGKLYVGTMMAQRQAGKPGEVPQVDNEALAACIRKAFTFATKQGNASVHIAKLDKVTGVNWAAVDTLLKSLAASTKLRCVVYARDGSLARTRTFAPTPGSLPSTLIESIASTTSSSVLSGASPPGSLPLNRTSSDLFNVPFFEGLRFFVSPSFSARESHAITSKVTMSGGVAVKDISIATHAVLTNATDPLMQTVNGASCAAILRLWVDDCFEKNKRLPLIPGTYALAGASSQVAAAVAPEAGGALGSDESPQMNRSSTGSVMIFCVMRDCRVVVEGFSAKESSEIVTKICMMGGKVADKWRTTGSEKSTHMVAASWSDNCERVSELGGVVVNRRWVDDALQAGKTPVASSSCYSVAAGAKAATLAQPSPPANVSAATTGPAIFRFAAPVTRDSPDVQKRPREELPATLRAESASSGGATPMTKQQILRSDVTPPSSPPMWTKPSSPPVLQSVTINDKSKRMREVTPPTVRLIDLLPVSAQHVGPVLRGVTLAIEGYSAELTHRLTSLLSQMGAVVIPSSSFSPVHCRLMICETLTSVSLRLRSQHSAVPIVTLHWVKAVIDEKRFVEPQAERFLYRCQRASSPTKVPCSAADDITDTDDDELPPPPKAARQERLAQLQPAGLPPTLLAPVDDDDKTQTASTVSDLQSPGRGALDDSPRDQSPASTVSAATLTEDDAIAPPGGRIQQKAPVATPITPSISFPSSLFENCVAVLFPFKLSSRSPDEKVLLNEAKRFVIAYGGDTVASLDELEESMAELSKQGKSIILLTASEASHTMAASAGLASIVAITKGAVPCFVKDRTWVTQCLSNKKVTFSLGG